MNNDINIAEGIVMRISSIVKFILFTILLIISMPAASQKFPKPDISLLNEDKIMLHYKFAAYNEVTVVGKTNTMYGKLVRIPSKINYKGIDYKVTKIETLCFSNHFEIEEINLSNTIKQIGKSAFYNCKNLKRIVLSSAVTEINSYVFSECRNLADVSMMLGVEIVGWMAFENCTSLRTIRLPKGAKIDETAFTGTNVIVIDL